MPKLEYFCHQPQLLLEDKELITLIKRISKINFRNEVLQELLEATSIYELYLTISSMFGHT